MTGTSKKNNDRTVKNPLSQGKKIKFARSEKELVDMRKEPSKKKKPGKKQTDGM